MLRERYRLLVAWVLAMKGDEVWRVVDEAGSGVGERNEEGQCDDIGGFMFQSRGLKDERKG